MKNKDLIFDWRDGDGHGGRNLVSWIVVGVLAMVIGGFIKVKMGGVRNDGSTSASVMLFADEGMRRYWTMKAEEDGPYPGGFRIRENDAIAGSDGDFLWRGMDGWNEHEIKMQAFVEDENGGLSLFERGKKYFPERRVVNGGQSEVPKVSTRRVPVISAYEKDAESWIPKEIPAFDASGAEFSSNDVWRFLLRLGKDGRVEHCMPLSGGEEELKVLVEWVEGIRFAVSDKAERWMGVRVEFKNISGDDPESE